MINKIQLYLYVMLFPVKSITMFEKDVLTSYILDPDSGKTNNLTDIRSLFMKEISPYYTLHSYDELDLAIQKYYPFFAHKVSASQPLENIYAHYFKTVDSLTDSFITIRDGNISYKYWENKEDGKLFGISTPEIKIQIFHYLIRFIPIDILVINMLLKNYENNLKHYKNSPLSMLNGIYFNINIADSQLDEVLSRGVAENHMHVGAGYNFGISWVTMMNQTFNENGNYFKALNHLFTENDKYLVYHASAIRLVLSILSLKETLSLSKEEIKQYIVPIINLKSKIYENNDTHTDLYYEYNKFFYDMIEKNNLNIEHLDKDIVFLIFNQPPSKLKTSGENLFLFKALPLIRQGCCNHIYELFFDYLRVKNYVYNKIVEVGTVKGLRAFQELFANASKSISFTNGDKWREFFRTNFQNVYMKKLEARCSLPNKEKPLHKLLLSILEAYKEVIDADYRVGESLEQFPMFGLVFHFNKKSDYGTNKCWKNYDESSQATYSYLHFKEIQDEYFTQLKNLIKIRNTNPYISYFILGLDAASQENDTPTAVLAPVFRAARDSCSDMIFNIDENGNRVIQKSLRFTYHAGEDFRHVHSGLRKIDEVIEYCKLHSGDRIGHGIALGCDIDTWVKNNPIILLPRIEHLENLLWIWGIYSKSSHQDVEIVLYLEREITRYSEEIYLHTEGLTIPMLYKAYQKSFEPIHIATRPNTLDTVNANEKKKGVGIKKVFCIQEHVEDAKCWDVEKLIYARHCQCYLNRMNEPVFLEINHMEQLMMKKNQSIMIDKVAKMGIVIETNPSSNVVIGEMDTVHNHPAFLLKGNDNSKNNNVIININSDDPTVFSTNVSNELAFIYYSMLNKGNSKDLALKWVNDVREIGLASSFIDNKISHSQFYDYLCKAINNLKH